MELWFSIVFFVLIAPWAFLVLMELINIHKALIALAMLMKGLVVGNDMLLQGLRITPDKGGVHKSPLVAKDGSRLS